MSLISTARSVHYRKVYKKHGFFWNDELKEFVQEYGGKQLDYKDPHSGFIFSADFRFPLLIKGAQVPGRSFDYYTATAKYLDEDVALVGKCGQGYIHLLLTENGRFIGFDEYTLIRWG